MKEKIKDFFNYFWGRKLDQNLTEQGVSQVGGKNKFLPLALGLVIILGLVFSGLALLRPSVQNQGRAVFTLTNSRGTGVIITKKEKLILKSNLNFSEDKIKELLVFKPNIDVRVKKVFKLLSFFNAARAATTTDSDLLNEYEIIPATDLNEGKVYSVAIATSSEITTDHKYSWAFQVEAPFQASSPFPGDKSTDVPLNTGIEITFNRDRFRGFENNFQIEPEAKGKFEVRYNTLVFLPAGDLLEKTIYKVTVKKGISRDGSDEVTNEDYVFSFETKSKTQEYHSNSMGWAKDYYQLRPGNNSFLDVYANGTSSPEITIYKFTNSEDFRKEYFRYLNFPFKWANWSESKYAPAGAVKNSTFRPEIMGIDWQKFIEAPTSLENGLYVFEMNSEGTKTYTFVQKSPLAFYYSLLNVNSLIWVYDYENKKPAADLDLKFYDQKGVVVIGKTGADGLLEFNTPEGMRVGKDRIEQTPVYFEAKKEGLPTYVIISNDTNLQKYDKYWNYLTVDRPIYALKDKINFWGVAKGRDQDLKEKKLTVGLYQNWSADGDPLASKEILVSPFNTFSGQLDFAGIDPGVYSLVAKFNDDIVAQTSVQIFSYTKPAYKIEVETEKDNYWAGENVKFKVKASFFDGTPVSGLKLKYNLNWASTTSSEVTLNDQGEAAVEYKPEYFFKNDNDSWTNYPQGLSIDFSPALAEEGSITGSSYVSIYGPNVYLQSFAEKLSGDNYKIEARVNKIDLNSNDSIGIPQSGQALNARIIRFYYLKKEVGEIYDPIYKTKSKQYEYELKQDEIENLNGVTDSEGKWNFTKELKPIDWGWYRIVFSGKDSQGRDIKSLAYSGYDMYPGGDMTLSLKNLDAPKVASYKNGDQINFQAITQGQGELLDNKVLFYRYTDKFKKAEVKSDFNLTDTFNDDYVPSVRYTAVVPGPNGFLESGSELISFDSNERKLNIDIKPEQDKYRPKDQVKINFNIKDKDQNNVQAAVNVAAVDEALFNITSSYQGEILSTLYTSLASSPVTKSTVFFSKNVGAEKGGCFVGGTLIKTPAGDKPIEDIRVGDVIITRNTENDHNEKKAVVQGVSSHLVVGYISINKTLNLTPEHVIYLNGRWQQASQARLGDDLLGVDGNVVKVSSIATVPEKNIRVYNILVGKYHTYFASGIYVHNAEKGGGTVRTDFQDVPLFQNLITDAHGNATVEFKAPDNITSWRVTANAYEPEKMLAGSNYKLVPVGLPLFVDVVLNKFYLAGDAPILKLRAFGSGLSSTTPIEFSLKSPALGLNQTITSAANAVEIPTGVLKEGKYKITISARQGDLTDTVEREINVVGNYFRSGTSAQAKITNGQVKIRGNVGGFTNITFVDASTGKYFDDIVSASYGGYLRSDRYVASFYGQKLLEKYFGRKPIDESLDLSPFYKNGLALLPYGSDDLELTAKLSDLASDYLSTNLIKGYLESATGDKQADIKRIAIALYGLASLHEPVLDQVEYLRNSDKLDDASRVYLALALVKLGAEENARDLYQSVAANFKDYQAGYLLEPTSDENQNLTVTAMAGVLAAYLGEESDVAKIWTAISTADRNKVALELEKIMIINHELATANPEKTTFSYKTLNSSGDVDLSEGGGFWLYLSEDDLNSLTFSKVSGQPVAISFYEESVNPASLVKNNDLKIQRQYLVDNSETSEFKEGSLVLVRLSQKIGQRLPDDSYEIIDYLPAGLRPMTAVYEPSMSSNDGCNPVWYPTKVVDNAVYFQTGKWFESSKDCPKKTMNYYARVVNKGEFRAQPVLIQSIEHEQILNISDEKKVKIK